jgi:hypothetical protein
MTAIEGVGRRTTTRLGGRTSVSVGTGFVLPSAPDETNHTKATAAAAPAASLGSMLTLQELGGETPEGKETRRHGQDMLALLAQLQRDLLLGADDMATLVRLAELAAAVPRATDPRLAAMISAIIVRVRVELARRQV